MEKLTFKVITGNERSEEIIEINLDSDELKLLELFQENFNRLRSSVRILENDQVPVLKKISFSQEKGLDFVFSDFNYQHISELLHLLRPFLLKKESTSFDMICAIFNKKARKTSFALVLKSIRNMYEKGDYQPYFQLSLIGNHLSEESFNNYINGIIFGEEYHHNKYERIDIFSEGTLKVWLNGREYHQDEDKRLLVERLEESFGSDVARSLFVSQLSGKVRAIYALMDLVNQMLLPNKN